MSCGSSGRPSADGTIRLYSKSECDALDGIYHANGECTKKGGGSWSWDCRDLNTQAAASNSITQLITSGVSSRGDMKNQYLLLAAGAVAAYALYKKMSR